MNRGAGPADTSLGQDNGRETVFRARPPIEARIRIREARA